MVAPVALVLALGLVRPWTSRVALSTSWRDALSELAASLPPPSASTLQPPAAPALPEEEERVGFLFVNTDYCDDQGAGQPAGTAFAEIVQAAHESLGVQTLVSVISDGVIGGGRELEGEPALALLTGCLPRGSRAHPIAVRAPGDLASALSAAAKGEAARADRPPSSGPSSGGGSSGGARSEPHSFILIADPFCESPKLLLDLESQFARPPICGGLSAPPGEQPSIAVGGSVLPVGSAVALGLAGSVVLHTVVAQGCARIGPPLTVTAAHGSLVLQLDGRPALEQLSRVAQMASDTERTLMEHSLLCGLAPPAPASATAAAGEEDERDASPTPRGEEAQDSPTAAGGGRAASGGLAAGGADDYLVRIILGATEQGALLIGADGVEEGQQFHFHVRDRRSAQSDLDAQLQRYRLERQFSSSAATLSPAAPLAALLFSCNGRGCRLFGVANHDSECIQAALSPLCADGTVPLGGFFANGEIGPVGVRLGSDNPGAQTHMHGFTSVIGLLYGTDDEAR
jgi:small ligand-binding sensory domain FIST